MKFEVIYNSKSSEKHELAVRMVFGDKPSHYVPTSGGLGKY